MRCYYACFFFKIMISFLHGKESPQISYFFLFVLIFAVYFQISLGLDFTQEGADFICSNKTLLSATGTLFSSNFPDFYDNMEHCEISLTISDAIIVEIYFEVFHTESFSDLNLSDGMCYEDYLELKTESITRRFCGNWQGRERLLYFSFNTSWVTVTFASNKKETRQGFVLKWSSKSASYYNTENAFCKNALLETEQSCFNLVRDRVDWITGHETCNRHGASLAKIDDFETNHALWEELKGSDHDLQAVWIGANDRMFKSEFMWPNRTAIEFQNWLTEWINKNQSSSSGASQHADYRFEKTDCIEMRRALPGDGDGIQLTQTFFWNDRNCDEKKPFICQHIKRREKRSAEVASLSCDKIYRLTLGKLSVIITSPGYPGLYPPLASCHSIIIAPPKKQIFIDFLQLDVEDGKQCEYDNITLSEVPLSRRNVSYCGNWNRKLKFLRWTSEVNQVIVTFRSDDSRHFPGFRLNASLIDNAPLCQHNDTVPFVYGPLGCWMLGNSTGTYQEAEEACATVDAEVAKVLEDKVNFLSSVIGSENGCTELWQRNESSEVKISNETDTICPAVGICCDVNQTDSALRNCDAKFVNVPCTSRRQVLCWRPAKQPVRSVVNRTETSSAGQFDFFLPNGKNYSNSFTLNINLKANPGYRIVLELLLLDIEPQDQCLYDSLQTFGMVQDGKYCGESTETVSLISKFNNATLQFYTDEDVTAAGFRVSWYLVKCNEAFEIDIQGGTGIIQSVKFPKAFPDTINNCTQVTVPDNKRMYVEIVNMSLPGSDCSDSNFTVRQGVKVIKTFCGGDSMQTSNMLDRMILLESGPVKFCLVAPALWEGEGLRAAVKTVNVNGTKLRSVITVAPNESIAFSNIMFPEMFPSQTTQEIIFRTIIGYKIEFLAQSIKTLRSANCSLDKISVFDISLKKNDVNETSFFSCSNISAAPEILRKIEFETVLNAIKLVIRSGCHDGLKSSLQISGIVSSVQDPYYLNNTVKALGSFDECDNTTCKNGAKCYMTPEGRFTCTCPPQKTGLFCQASQCDLKPCQHGSCREATSGFSCLCSQGYYGSTCAMDKILCQYRFCSGHGYCMMINGSETKCVCDSDHTGPQCNSVLPKEEELVTIGQKLLKEPIWIGMIVMVNLVLVFSVSYVIRRNCEKRISKLFAPKSKPSSSNSKDDSRVEASVSGVASSDNRHIYSISTDMTQAPSGSRWSTRRTQHRKKLDFSSVSVPSTPVVDENNKDAALKLFASYNANKHQLSPHIAYLSTEDRENGLNVQSRDVMACGILGGMVTLHKEDDCHLSPRDIPRGMMRAHTISTELKDFESARSSKRLKDTRKCASYNGSPSSSVFEFEQSTRIPKLIISPTSPELNRASSSNTLHFYPEIKIINENSRDKFESNSDDSTDCEIQHCETTVLQSKPDDHTLENVPESKPSEQTDSGYPSTSISTIYSNSHVNENLRNLKTSSTASEKRKRFSSKTKSASFYNLSTMETPTVDNLNTEMTKTKESSICSTKDTVNRHSFSNVRSFESEMCTSCRREKLEPHANSYETGLNRLRHGRHKTSDYTNVVAQQRRNRRRRKNENSKHHHDKRSDELPREHNESFLSYLSRRSRNYPNNSRQVSFNDYQDFTDMRDARHYHHNHHHHRRPQFNSSTESDSCLCFHQASKRDRRHRFKNCYSDCSVVQTRMHSTCSQHSHHEFDRSSRHSFFHSDDSCKASLMKSFLSDTYLAKCQRNTSYSDENSKMPGFLASDAPTSSCSSAGKDGYCLSPFRGSPSPLPSPQHYRLAGPDNVFDHDEDTNFVFNVTPVSKCSPDAPQNQINSPVINTHRSVVNKHPQKPGNSVSSLNVCDDSQQMPDVEYVSRPNYSYIDQRQSETLAKLEGKLSYDVNASFKDSAYQTKQPSVDRIRGDKLWSTSSSVKSRSTTRGHRQEDQVQNHLRQAAMKLAFIKRLQNKQEMSKDSAVQTFSEDDLTGDDEEIRGPMGRRTSNTLVFQLRENALSKVQEEHSGVSKDTDTYNTPTNEPFQCSFDSTDILSTSGIQMTEISNYSTSCDISVLPLEETNV